MNITKDHVGKDIWLEPSDNNVLRGLGEASKKANRGRYYKVIKVARVNITVAEVKSNGELWRAFEIKRSNWRDDYYKSGLNAGYYAYLDEKDYEHSTYKTVLAGKIVNEFRSSNMINRLSHLPVEQIKDVALLLDINLEE